LADVIEHDFHRNALNNFDEIASGVVGWEKRKGRSGAGLQAVNVCAEKMIGNGVDFYVDVLTDAHPGDLCFLKISQDPDILFDHGHEGLTGLNARTGLDCFLGDQTVGRRNDPGVGKLKFGVT
jgi:hypothetical protein